jgi:hypothetical protein
MQKASEFRPKEAVPKPLTDIILKLASNSALPFGRTTLGLFRLRVHPFRPFVAMRCPRSFLALSSSARREEDSRFPARLIK